MTKGRSYKNYTLDEKKLDYDDEINVKSANRLTELITACGKSIATIESELIDAGTPISYSTLYKYKSDGISTPYGLSVLAKYFRTTTDYLLGLSDTVSPDITIQEIGKETGLTDNAIKQLQFINKNYKFKGDNPLNYLLGHMMIPHFITCIYNAIECSELDIEENALSDEEIQQINNLNIAVKQLGGTILYEEEAVSYYRQEAINVLRDIVYDLVPDRKEKKEVNHGNNSKER